MSAGNIHFFFSIHPTVGGCTFAPKKGITSVRLSSSSEELPVSRIILREKNVFDAFTTGNPSFLTKLLEFSTGRDLGGALKGSRLAHTR